MKKGSQSKIKIDKVQTHTWHKEDIPHDEINKFREEVYDDYDLVMDKDDEDFAQFYEVEPSTPAPKKDKVLFDERLKCQVRSSLLSDDNTEPTKYDGFFNLAFMMLIVSHFRLIIENVAKHGLLLNLPHYVTVYFEENTSWPALITFCSFNLWIMMTVVVENYFASAKKAKKHHESTEWSIYFIHLGILTCIVTKTVYVINNYNVHPFSGIVLMTALVILLMKLYSYSQVMAKIRLIGGHEKYPENLTVGDMYYFLMAPTLVYEPDFPRTDSIRWKILLRLVLSFVFYLVMMDFMVEQYIFPITQSNKHSDRIGDFTKLLKLTIPNITVWLLMFASFFHCWLNIMAEILRFGDRLFYLDWWNCTSMDFFWRTWNLPVHKWLVVHVYLPIIDQGFSQSFASAMVFFISAIGHEVIISVPFHSFKTWAFWAMMSQMPLCYWTKRYTKGHIIGNILFWSSFMFGQANCILMYYKDFQNQQ